MLNPAHWLRRWSRHGRKATELYGSVVTQARHPAFYSQCGVPDTPTGRYEVLVLHLSVMLNALHAQGPEQARLSRALVEHFVGDMDDTMRELAFGDTSVPRRVKKVAAGLRERSLAYREALTAGSGSLEQCIAANFGFDPTDPSTKALAAYGRDLVSVCDTKGAKAVDLATVRFPDPSAYGSSAAAGGSEPS